MALTIKNVNTQDNDNLLRNALVAIKNSLAFRTAAAPGIGPTVGGKLELIVLPGRNILIGNLVDAGGYFRHLV